MPSARSLIVLVLPLLIGSFYSSLGLNNLFISRHNGQNYNKAKNILLVTAHPDDEAMFFAPTILALTKTRDISLFHLCLSNGNSDGLGNTRKIELGYSLDILGVDRQKRWIIDHPDLQDNITIRWDPEVIAKTITPYISGLKIDTILTFDSHGVSGHPNHRAIPAGVKSLIRSLQSASSATAPRLFSLVSEPLLTKYLGSIAAPIFKIKISVHNGKKIIKRVLADSINYWRLPYSISIITNTNVTPAFLSGYSEYLTALSAMFAHYSQMVWYRWLYVTFSRYMWVNCWEEVRDFST